MPYYRNGGNKTSSSPETANILYKTASYQGEERIANAVLQDRISFKENALSRLTSYKTKVIYYQARVNDRNDNLINTNNIGTIDTSKRSFYEIKDFIILCQGETSANIESKEVMSDLNANGSAKILPNTIKPNKGDFFIMNTYNKDNLYKITDVTKSTLEDDSAYEINYYLVEENSIEEIAKIKSLVIEKYTFIYAHVGTSFRTIFKDEEYVSLKNMYVLYNRFSEVFNELFYDKDRNTYLLVYNNLSPIIKRFNSSDIFLSPGAIGDKTSYNCVSENTRPPKYRDSDSWLGSLMYDRFLIEFIRRNNLFTRVNDKIYAVEQLDGDKEKWYSRTIFYAVEKQNNKQIAFKSLIPSPIEKSTIASNLNLYGTVMLEPCFERNEGMTIDLYPPALLSDILWENTKERSIKDVSVNTYEDMVDLMCETIGLYVQKKDESILQRLNMMYSKIDEFMDIIPFNQYIFYLFPLISFITLKTMDRLSDKNFGNFMNY